MTPDPTGLGSGRVATGLFSNRAPIGQHAPSVAMSLSDTLSLWDIIRISSQSAQPEDAFLALRIRRIHVQPAAP